MQAVETLVVDKEILLVVVTVHSVLAQITILLELLILAAVVVVNGETQEKVRLVVQVL
jgi:hypothetical protein